MNKKRLLALVLCFVMLFSDATSTFASSLSDTPVVITEVSDETEETELTGTEVAESEKTETEETDTSKVSEKTETLIDGTEEVVPEEQTTETTETTETPVVEPEEEPVTQGTEIVEDTEAVEDTEILEDTTESTELLEEEIVEPERVGEGETLTASVSYMNGEESVAIGDGQYATLAEAKTAIETFLNENTDFAGAIQVSLNLDTTFSGEDLALEHDNAWIELHMNGHTLSLSADAYVRANIESSESQAAFLLNDNYTLTLLPTSQASDGMTNTDISNVQIVGNQQDPIGKVIVGECRDSEGALVNRSIQLNDVPIINVSDIVFQGDMGYHYSDGDAATTELVVANEFRVENAYDDEAGIHQYMSVNASVQSANVVWNGNGSVSDLTVTDTLTTTADWQMDVRNSLNVNNIVVTAAEDVNHSFHIVKATFYDGDNGNALLSKATVHISGSVTANGEMNYPIAIQKKNIIQRTASDEYGSWIEEEHDDGKAFEVGEVVLTLGENAAVDAADFELQQWENDSRMMVKKENNQLVACEVGVEVNAHVWNEENQSWDHVGTRQYDSFGSAVAGIAEDFADVTGRFDIVLFKDAELTEDVTLPSNAIEINVGSAGMWMEITDEEGNVVDGYDHFVRRTFTFNGYTLTVQGNVCWQETVQILNDADAHGRIMAQEFYWECVDAGESFGLEDGTVINRAEVTNVVIDGVDIMMSGGGIMIHAWNDGYKYQVNGEFLGGRAEFGGSDWTIRRLILSEENGDGLYISESASVRVIGKTEVVAGNWAEVRGSLTLGPVFVVGHSQDPYASFNIQVVTGYAGQRDDEVADEQIYKGNLNFTGAITCSDTIASAPIRIEKKEIYRYQATDENGNLLWENEEEQIPWYNEDHYGDLDFASGETVAIVNDSTADANIFTAGGSGAVFAIEGQELKAYKAAVRVDVWWEEENTGAAYNYRTLEEAFANMEADFGGKAGHYTFTILENVQLSGDLTIPAFVSSLRMQADWRWCEHYDEDGNPIFIYDEEGNQIGVEGHDETDFATLDLNGFTLTSAAPIEFMEGLSVASTASTKGKVVVTTVTGEGYEFWNAVTYNQLTNGGLILEDGTWVERNEDYQWSFVENVDIVAENGGVQLWSTWCNYTINGNITANTMNVRGNWNVDNVTITTDLCLEAGWYDEATDSGEPEGFLTVENLTIDGGHVYNAGRIFVNDTFTVDGGIIDNQALIIADTFAMETGRFDNWGQVNVKHAVIQDFYAHTHIDFFEDDPATEENEEHVEQRGSIFICDTLTQPTNGQSWFDRGTTFVVNEKAVIYNPVIGGFNGDAWSEVNIHRMPNATIEMNGEVVCHFEDTHVSMSVFEPVEGAERFSFTEHVETDEEGNIVGSWYDVAFVNANGEIVDNLQNGWPVKVLEKNEVLFTTNTKNFPTDLIWLHQEGENIQYWSVYQNGNEIRVGGNWIDIFSLVDDGSQEHLASFSLWSEAEAFIAELSNPNISYIINISDDLDVEGKMTLPSKAKAVIITGAKLDGSQVELTYTGDLTLTSDVTFGFINLNAVDAAGKEYHSVVDIKGYTLKLFGVNADFASITGTKGSALVVVGAEVEGQKVTVDGAIKNVEVLDMGAGQLVVGAKLAENAVAISGLKTASLHGSVLVATNGSIAVTGDTILSQTTIKAKSKITLADVYSLDDRNKIVYAGNEAANILTITGSVYGPGDWAATGEYYLDYEGFFGVTADNQIVGFDDENRVDRIRCSAIDISVESLATKGYTPGDVLLNAPKVSPKWFVVGSQYGDDGARTSIASMTNKKGDQICYGAPAADAVTLYTWNDTVGSYLGYDSYPTLQDAFDVIETIGDKNGDYYIIMSEDMDNTNIPATLKTPTKAAFVIIGSENEAVTLYYKNELQVNSMVVLDNVILAPESANSKITLGNNHLYLQSGTKVAEGSKIASITGSGFGKGSVLFVHGTAFTVAGNVDKIDTIYLENAELNVQGKANIGDIVAYDTTDEQGTYNPTLVGTATVTRKNGKVTKLVPQITINGEMDYTASALTIALCEKTAAGTYEYIDFLAAEMSDMLAKGIQLAKAPKLASMMIQLSNKNIKDANQISQYVTTKANGYLVPQSSANVGATVSYTKTYELWNDETGEYEPTDILITSAVKTFADAVTEINNLKTKQAYEICLTSAAPALSLSAPTQLKMPNKNAVETLVIYSNEEVPVDLHYTGNITFTSDVFLMNVDFMQVYKWNGAYVPYDVNYVDISPVSVSAGGNEMYVSNVTFNTPVKLDGKKGELYVIGDFRTETNCYSQYFCGSITNFKEAYFADSFAMFEYYAGGKYVAPALSATSVQIFPNCVVELYSLDEVAKTTITDLLVENGELYTQGSTTIKNAELYGAAWVGGNGKLAVTNVDLYDNAMMLGVSDFVISGTVTSHTPNAILASAQKSATNLTPGLNITGKVILEDPTYKIGIMVTDPTGQGTVTITGLPNTYGQMLTAKNATADLFKAGVLGSGDEAVDNVNGKVEYSEANPEGYVFVKSGTGIYAYNGGEIAVEVLKDGKVFGYYNNLADATKAIDAEKAKEAVYEFVLLGDNGSVNKPVTIKAPQYASEVIISHNGQTIYVDGNISLGADVTLTFADVAEVDGNITGKGNLKVNQNTVVKGNVQAKDVTYANSAVTLNVTGTFTANTVTFNGGNTLDAQKNTVTIGNIVANGNAENTIIYGKNAKGAGNLTIKGKVESENPIVLNHVFTDMVEDDFRVIFEGDFVKLTLKEEQKIASIEKAPLSDFKVLFNGNEIALVNRLAKANKYVYLFSMEQIVSSSCVQLEMTKEGETSTTYFIDFTQAVNEINMLADTEADYVIHTGIRFGGLEDTNQLDNKNFGPLTLPKANTANSLTIVSDNQSEIYYSGNISYSGSLTIKDVTLVSMKAVGQYTDSNITVTKDKRGVAELNLINVSTYADGSWSNGKAEMTGFIGQISGTKNVTNVTLTNCDLRIKKGISKVDTLTLENSQLITCGAATVNQVAIADDLTATASSWDALGKTTVGDITVESWDRSIGYLAAKQDKKQVPTFTVTGDVNIVDGNGAIPVNVIPASASTTNISYLYSDQCANAGLVVAKTAGADKFIARPYRGIANILSYKDSKNVVKNGNADEMKVLLSYEGGETYAKSYAEAVTLINNIGDKNGVYTIQFLTAGEVTPNGTSYGALTFPTKAAEVFITGQVDPNNNNAPTTVLKYTGTMKPSVSVTFGNIILTEGKVDKGEFVPSYAVTPTVSKANVVIGFEAGATTLKASGSTETADLVFTAISGKKGSVAIFDRNVKVEKDAALATLYVSDTATVDVLGKLTVKDINVVNIASEASIATVAADGAMTITNINGIELENDALVLDTRYTATKKATDVSVSQLTVNGEINDVIVGITAEMYDFKTKSYHSMTEEEAEALLIVDENATPAKNQKIATMPKANVYDVTILLETADGLQEYAISEIYGDYATIVKHDGGLYMTNLPPVLGVTGFAPIYEDGEMVGLEDVYATLFLNWDQAVKEIDKIADKDASYMMVLLRNAGQSLTGEITPLKNLPLPSKAKEVIVTGENIFFTGKITAKTDTVFTDIGLMAVKQVKQGKDSWYESTKYDVAIGNNYVVMDNMHSYTELFSENGEYIGYFENLPGTVSGSKKAHFEFSRSFGEDYNYSNMPATKISGIGTVEFSRGEVGEGYENYLAFMTVPMGISGVNNLIVNPMVYLESWDGVINVKNLESTESIVYGKNLTVTGTTELKSGTLVAGTDVVGDGALKLKDVVLHDAYNALSAKQDKNGKSLMQITGTVTASEAFYEEHGEDASTEGALTVEIRYNNDVSYAQLYNGFMLLTAPKADASWFVPFYSYTMPIQATDEEGNPIFDEETGEPVYVPMLDEEGNPIIDEATGEPVYEEEYFPGMGWENEDYRVYKLGKAIYYGYGAQ